MKLFDFIKSSEFVPRRKLLLWTFKSTSRKTTSGKHKICQRKATFWI